MQAYRLESGSDMMICHHGKNNCKKITFASHEDLFKQKISTQFHCPAIANE